MDRIGCVADRKRILRGQLERRSRGCGDAVPLGGLSTRTLNAAVVGIAPTPMARGTGWQRRTAGVSFGDASFYGSMVEHDSMLPWWGSQPRPMARGTGWQRRTAGCSRSATPRSTVQWVEHDSMLPWWGSQPRPMARGTGWQRRTAGCSRSAVRPLKGRWAGRL